MSSQEMNELNALQVLDYDIFGQCNDMMSFIKNQPPIQRDEQIQVKIGAVAKLTNLLIKFLKESNNTSLNNQQEYYDIVYIINNNLSQKIKQYEEKIRQMTVNDQQSKMEIAQQKQDINKWMKDSQEKQSQINQLKQENDALKHQYQLLEEQNFETITKMSNENDTIKYNENQTSNEVNQLKKQLKLYEEKISDQEGKINQLNQQIQKLQTDQSQDRKDPLFYQQQQIFEENQKLKEYIREFSLYQNPIQFNTVRNNDHNPQQNKEDDQIFTQEIKEIENKIFGYLDQLSLFGILLSACIGAFVVIQYYQ